MQQRMIGFDLRSVYVEYAVNKVALGHISLQVPLFSLAVPFPHCCILMYHSSATDVIQSENKFSHKLSIMWMFFLKKTIWTVLYNMYPETIRFRDTRHRQMAQGEWSKHWRFVDKLTVSVEDSRLKMNVLFTGSDVYPVQQYFEDVLLINSKLSPDIAWYSS